MSKPHTHQLDIYGVELSLATNKRQWSILRRRLSFVSKKAPQSVGLSHFACWEPKAGIPVPVLVFWIDLAALAGDAAALVDTCAHEASHGANQILGWIGHDIRGTDEPHAYLTGWLTRWIWEACSQ